MPHAVFSSEIPVPARELFLFHSRPGAFERLRPPWERIEIVDRQGSIRDGDTLKMRIRKGPLWLTWLARHEHFEDGRGFEDVQVKGPFARWRHRHRFLPRETNLCELRDEVDYTLPLGAVGAALGAAKAAGALDRMFAFRHRRTRDDLTRHARWSGSAQTQAILLGDDSAFLRELACFLSAGGVGVHRLVRVAPAGGPSRFAFKDCFSGETTFPLDHADALIDAGAAQDRNEPESFTEDLQFLLRALPTAARRPDLLLRLRGQRENLDAFVDNVGLDLRRKPRPEPEDEAREDLLDHVGALCEREATLHFGNIVRAPMTRMVNLLLRLETFLFLRDGARSLDFSWISLDDALGAVLFAMHRPGLRGDVAAVAPNAGSRASLQQLLVKRNFAAYTLHRIFKVLPWAAPGGPPALQGQFAEMAQLGELGFEFLTPDLEQAVAHELGDAPRL